MLYAGEDPRYLFRRLLILAAEDVGLADPQALAVVVSAAGAFDYVGLPRRTLFFIPSLFVFGDSPQEQHHLVFFEALAKVEQKKKPRCLTP